MLPFVKGVAKILQQFGRVRNTGGGLLGGATKFERKNHPCTLRIDGFGILCINDIFIQEHDTIIKICKFFSLFIFHFQLLYFYDSTLLLVNLSLGKEWRLCMYISSYH